MFNNLWHEMCFLKMRYIAWKEGKVIGISRSNGVRIYDYRNKEEKSNI